MSVAQKRKRSEPANGVADDKPESKKLAAACTECRKQKIKCQMVNEEPPCSRCERRGLSCVLHTALRNPGADHRQLGLLGKDVGSMYATLERVCHHLNLEPPTALLSDQSDGTDAIRQGPATSDEQTEDGMCELSPPASPSTVQAPIDTYLQAEPSPDGTSPQRRRRRMSERPDLISKGLITAENAEVLVQLYLFRLDRFLYGIANQHKDLNDVRRASPVLLAAMCAVSAFHDVEHRDLFDVSNREYRSLVSASMFEKHDVEYIRALCIGSFWLPDASRILCSEAIRRAADCRLHRNFYRLTEPFNASSPSGSTITQEDARDRIRLWYLLFICDQHLSVLHNRDCVIRQEKDAIESREFFLATESQPSNQDIRLISQVSLLVIMGQVRDVFGSEQTKPVPKTLSVQYQHFARELDQWFARFSGIFEPDPNIGSFPLAGLTMHYQFGKLYLGHHVFRGLGTDPIPLHFLAAAAGAREAAITIFSMITENEAFKGNIVGMPHYFHIMISFAGHFLLEVCMKYREQLNVIADEDFRRVSAVLALFARTPAMPQHPISRVTAGLMRKLNECTANLGMESVLTGSPFGNPEFVAARDFAGNTANGSAFRTPFDLQLANGLPDDFLYADFGDFTFSQTQFPFVG